MRSGEARSSGQLRRFLRPAETGNRTPRTVQSGWIGSSVHLASTPALGPEYRPRSRRQEHAELLPGILPGDCTQAAARPCRRRVRGCVRVCSDGQSQRMFFDIDRAPQDARAQRLSGPGRLHTQHGLPSHGAADEIQVRRGSALPGRAWCLLLPVRSRLSVPAQPERRNAHGGHEHRRGSDQPAQPWGGHTSSGNLSGP